MVLGDLGLLERRARVKNEERRNKKNKHNKKTADKVVLFLNKICCGRRRTSELRTHASGTVSAEGSGVATTIRTGVDDNPVLGAPVVGTAVGGLALVQFPEGNVNASGEDTVPGRRIRSREIPPVVLPGLPPTGPVERDRAGLERRIALEPTRVHLAGRREERDRVLPCRGPERDLAHAAPRVHHEGEREAPDVLTAVIRAIVIAILDLLGRGGPAPLLVIVLDPAADRQTKHDREHQEPLKTHLDPPLSIRCRRTIRQPTGPEYIYNHTRLVCQ